MLPIERVFVTGTDTGVGKTVISTMLAKGLEAHYWKPIQTGATESPDAEFAGLWLEQERICKGVYQFPEALSPHAAAQINGGWIDLEKILKASMILPKRLVIEGAGGALVPLNDEDLMVDLIQALQIPAVVVARTTLGTINHSLMTIEALRAREVEVRGMIFVGDPNDPSISAIAKYGRVEVLGRIPFVPVFSKDWFAQSFQEVSKGGFLC